MSTLKNRLNHHRQSAQTLRTITMRAHLNADALFNAIREDFDKDPNLLAFDDRRFERPESLHCTRPRWSCGGARR